MRRARALALALLAPYAALPYAALPYAALAESVPADSVLAEYYSTSGPLPPEYAWDVQVSILDSGQLILKRCTGYETEGPACTTRKAKVTPVQIQAIHDAVAEAELATRPIAEAEDFPVGGGVSGGTVYLDGTALRLPPWPAEQDAARSAKVLRAIRAAIPDRLVKRFIEGN